MQVELNDFERSIGMAIAKNRYTNARGAGVHNKQISNEKELEPDIEGAMSELAMCKLLNIYPTDVFNFDLRSAKSKTDNGDLIYNNFCIDVKATKYKSGRLIATQKNSAIDYLCLMTGNRGSYFFAGAMDSKNFYTESRWGRHPKLYRDCYAASQEELTPPETFLKRVA